MIGTHRASAVDPTISRANFDQEINLNSEKEEAGRIYFGDYVFRKGTVANGLFFDGTATFNDRLDATCCSFDSAVCRSGLKAREITVEKVLRIDTDLHRPVIIDLDESSAEKINSICIHFIHQGLVDKIIKRVSENEIVVNPGKPVFMSCGGNGTINCFQSNSSGVTLTEKGRISQCKNMIINGIVLPTFSVTADKGAIFHADVKFIGAPYKGKITYSGCSPIRQ
ncbi:MAG: hypothetical protein KDK72_05580 [Chlamydiia bacterium]|nr:hypothetical protein [Chlamydiia bacterium]